MSPVKFCLGGAKDLSLDIDPHLTVGEVKSKLSSTTNIKQDNMRFFCDYRYMDTDDENAKVMIDEGFVFVVVKLCWYNDSSIL